MAEIVIYGVYWMCLCVKVLFHFLCKKNLKLHGLWGGGDIGCIYFVIISFSMYYCNERKSFGMMMLTITVLQEAQLCSICCMNVEN